MKITICEEVTVETDVEVSVHDVLAEFSNRLQQAESHNELPVKSVFLPLVDFATRLLGRIPSRGIGQCADSQRAEVVKRLQSEADRWNAIMESAED